MFIIRNATILDMPKILKIYNGEILQSFSLYKEEETTLAEREDWFKNQSKMNYPVIIAQSSQNKEIMGYASFSDFRTFPCYRFVVEHSVYIAVSHRRKGVAQALMESLFKEAIVRNKKSMIAAIDSDNLSSISLHKKLGFEEKGYLNKIAYKFGTWRDLVLMQKYFFEDVSKG